MIIRYLLRYNQSHGFNWASMVNSFNTTDIHRALYREYAPLMHYCFLGMDNKTLYYSSPQGGRGEVTLRTDEYSNRKSECGVRIKLVLRANWQYVNSIKYGHAPLHARCQCYFDYPDEEELYLMLSKVIGDESELKDVLLDYGNFSRLVEKQCLNKHINRPTVEEHYYNLELLWDRDTQLALMADRPTLMQEPLSRCIISNQPFDGDWVHPEINGADSKAMEILLGKISSVNDTSKLSDLCEDVFKSGSFARETVFVVNNPDKDGKLHYPSTFYMPRMIYLDTVEDTQYISINTVEAVNMANGLYSFKAHGSDGWEYISVDEALTKHLLFYTAAETSEYVSAIIKQRIVNKAEVESKVTKMVSEAAIQKYKYAAEQTKNDSNNILMVTGAVTAFCGLTTIVVKTLAANKAASALVCLSPPITVTAMVVVAVAATIAAGISWLVDLF